MDQATLHTQERGAEDDRPEHGWHPDAVRKTLQKMDELLDWEYGSGALRSPFVAELVYDALQEARDAVESAVATGAKAVEAAERGLDETTSAFLAWAAKHDVDVGDERDARMTLRMNRESLSEVKRKLRKGYELWVDGGRDPADFRGAKVKFDDGSAALAGGYLPL